MRTTGVIAVAVVLAALSSVARAQEKKKEESKDLIGNVVILTSDQDGKPEGRQPKEVNVGGLVIVEIHDLGSAPVTDVKVKAGRAFRQLGQVRGVHQVDGEPLAGGGYTWCLLQPVNVAEKAEIEVSYKAAPFAGGKVHTVKYTVVITAADDDE